MQKLIEFMKVCIEGQGHFLTLAQGHLHIKNQNLFISETTRPFLTKYCLQILRYVEMKVYQLDAGHMAKMTKMVSLFFPGKKIFKVYYHIWAWKPSWLCNLHYFDEFSFTCTYKLTFNIWLKMGQWFLNKNKLNLPL